MNTVHYITYVIIDNEKLINRCGTCLECDYGYDFGDGSTWLTLTDSAIQCIDDVYIDQNDNDAIKWYSVEQKLLKQRRPGIQYKWSNISMSWIDIRPLEQKRIDKWNEVKQLRSTIEFSGFSWDGSMFDSDEISQSRIQGAVILAMQAISANQPFEIIWTLADNTTRVLSATDMVAVGQNLSIHVATQHEIARSLRSAINATTTDEELNAITWPAYTSGSAITTATVLGGFAATVSQSGSSDGSATTTGES